MKEQKASCEVGPHGSYLFLSTTRLLESWYLLDPSTGIEDGAGEDVRGRSQTTFPFPDAVKSEREKAKREERERRERKREKEKGGRKEEGRQEKQQETRAAEDRREEGNKKASSSIGIVALISISIITINSSVLIIL